MVAPWRALVASFRDVLGGPLFREFLGFGSATIAMQGSRVLSDLAVAAILGPSIWGSWYLLNLVVAYGALTQLGALNGMNREVPSALGRDRSDEADSIRRVALGVVLVATSAASAAFLLAAAFVPLGVALSDLLLVLILLAAHQLFGYAVTSLKATTRFMTVARLQLALAVLYPAFGIAGALLGGLVGFIAGQVLAYGAVAALSSRSREVIVRPRFDRARTRSLIAIGFPIMLVGVVNTLFMTVDRWIVVSFLGTEALGHYSLAILTLGAVGLLPQVIGQQVYPRMAFAWSARRDTNELLMLARRVRSMAFAVAFPAAAGVALVVPPLVRAFLADFTPGIAPLLVTMLVPLVAAVGQGFGGVLHMLNRQTWLLGAIVVASLVNGVIAALLVAPLGLTGVAIGTLVAHMLLSALRIWLGGRALRAHAVAELGRAEAARP